MPLKNRRPAGPRGQEEDVAEKLGGKRVVASGSMRHNKGDVVSADFLIDAKQTEAKSFTVGENTLGKLCLEAARRKRKPALQVDLLNAPRGQRSWVVLRLDDFLELTDKE